MSRPNLINLWPSGARERTNLKHRLIIEALLAGLLVILLTTAAAVFLNWRASKVAAVNDTLNQELNAVQAKGKNGPQAAGSEASHSNLSSQWREQRAGQLNWLASLGDLAGSGIHIGQIKQSDKSLLLSGETQDPTVAKEALERFVQKINRYRLLNWTLLESKEKSGQTTWHFNAELVDDGKNAPEVKNKPDLQKEQP